MANGIELATAWVTLVPSAQGMRKGIAAELRGVEADADRTGRAAGKKMGGGMSGAMVGIGKKVFAPLAAAAATVSLGSFFSDAIRGASDLEQSVGGVNTVFGKQAAAINAASAAASKNLGLSKNQYNELATTMGAMLKNQGFKDFGDQTQILIKRGADLAATFGGTTKESVEALSAALRGEYDPLERYGITLNESMINAELAANGQGKLKGAALEQAKAQARVKLIMKQSAAAQGQFAKESDTFAGKQERLTASWENFKAIVGTALLPAMSALLDVFTAVGGAMGDLFARVGGGEGVMARLKAGFDAIAKSPFGQWVSQLGRDIVGMVVPAFQEIKSAVTNDLAPAFFDFIKAVAPIAGAIAGIVGAIAGPVIKGAIEGVINLVKGAVGIITGIFKVISGVLTGDWGKAWEGIKQATKGAIDFIIGMLQVGFIGRVVGIFRVLAGPIVKLWSKFGETLVKGASGAASGVVNGFTGMWTGIANAFNVAKSWVAAAIAPIWNGVKTATSVAWEGIRGVIVGAWNSILAVFNAIRSWVSSILTPIWNGLRSVVSTVWSAISGSVRAAWDGILTVFNTLRSWVTSILTGAFNAFKNLAAAVWREIGENITAAWVKIRDGVFVVWRIWLVSTLTSAFNTLRDIAGQVWSAISGAISNAWSFILNRVFTPLRTWVTSTLTGAWTTLRSAASNAWSGITSAVSNAYSRLVGWFNALRTWAVSTLTGAWNLLRSVAATAWSGITSAVSNAYSRLVGWFTPLRTWATSTLTGAFNTLRGIMSSVWSGITTTIGNAWSRISTSFTHLKNGVNQVWSFFQSAQRGIADVWSRLTGSVQGPINATRSWINSNLVSKMNSALGGIGVSLRVPALAKGGLWLGPGVTKAASGSVLPGYTPGRDVHRFWSPTGGRLDLSGGEAIMVPEWVRALGPALIRQMNAIARRGGVGAIRRFLFGDGSRGAGAGDTPYLGRTAFASGGIWRPRSFAGGGVLDTLKGVGGAVLDFFGNPFGAFVGLGKAILGDLPNNAGFAWGMARGFIPKVAEGVANKAKSLLASMFGGTGPVGNGTASGNVMGWQNQWNWLRNAVPGVRLNSGFRPGAITATGNRSYHSRGRAIDVTPSMAVFNRIKSAWGSRIAELIYSPANGGQVWHGRPHMYTGVTRSMHWNHVHWAMKHGGLFDGVKLFDQGGLLRRGDVAVHQGMKPDRVLTDAQWKAVMRHLPVQQHAASPWAALQGGVHVHGDVYGDPERFAKKTTTRLRDELALVSLAGV